MSRFDLPRLSHSSTSASRNVRPSAFRSASSSLRPGARRQAQQQLVRPDLADIRYPQERAALRRAEGEYAGWGFSQAFYRQELDLKALGYSSLEDFLVAFWEGFFLPKDANNLLTMLWTWQHGDISANEMYGGDFHRALGAIKAKAFVMPGQTDLYSPPADSENDAAHMPNARLIPIPSVWGHFAGGPGTSPDDIAFVDARLKELLDS